MKQSQKPYTKAKKVIDRGKRSKILSQVKPVENISSNMALKLPRYFYLLTEKPLGRYFQVGSPYYKPAQFNQKTPIPVS